jgi:hypothetical protein
VGFAFYEPAKADTLDPSANQKATCQDGFFGGRHLSLESSQRLAAWLKRQVSIARQYRRQGIASKISNSTNSFFEKSAVPSLPAGKKGIRALQNESPALQIEAVNTIYPIRLYALDR